MTTYVIVPANGIVEYHHLAEAIEAARMEHEDHRDRKFVVAQVVARIDSRHETVITREP